MFSSVQFINDFVITYQFKNPQTGWQVELVSCCLSGNEINNYRVTDL